MIALATVRPRCPTASIVALKKGGGGRGRELTCRLSGVRTQCVGDAVGKAHGHACSDPRASDGRRPSGRLRMRAADRSLSRVELHFVQISPLHGKKMQSRVTSALYRLQVARELAVHASGDWPKPNTNNTQTNKVNRAL